MSCLSQEEIREALFELVANKLHKKAEKDEVLDLPVYVKEIYDFVKEASEDEATAISAAAMTPVIIDKILSASDKLTEKLENKNPDVRIDALQLLRKFKNNTDAVRETVGATKPVAIDDETLKSSASITVTDERPTSKVKGAIDRFMTWAFQTFRVDIKNYTDPTADDWMKAKVEEALNFTVQKKINKALKEQSVEDSSEMKLDGVKGGVYLRAINGTALRLTYSSLIPKNEEGLLPFLFASDIYMVLTNEAGEPIQFNKEGDVVSEGEIVYLRTKSKAPMDSKGNFISHKDEALTKYIDTNVTKNPEYSVNAKKSGARAVRAIAESIQKQLDAMAKGYNPNYKTDKLTDKENEELRNRASDELKAEYQVLEKMRDYVKANPGKLLLSVMTGTADGFVPYSPYLTTPLKDINFEQGFQPRVIKETQSATSNLYQSGVYFNYPNVDEPISINKKPLVQQEDVLNNIIDLFTKDLWVTINGVLQPIPIGRREELINQFIVNTLHNVYFMADRKSGTINYEDKDGTINIMVDGTRYPLKFDGSKSGQEAAANAIKKHLTKGVIVYNPKNGRYPLPAKEDKNSINNKKDAEKAAEALGTQIIYAEYETDENGIKTIKRNDLERANKPGVYAIQKGTNYDYVGSNGQPEYDYFHINMPSIVIVDKLIEPGYDQISFTQDGDKTILNTKNASYKDFIKNNFTTNAVPYNYNNSNEKGKIELVNSSATFSPTADSMIKLAGGENNSPAVSNQEEIARLRAEEQELLKKEIPNIDAYKVDGKVNPFLIATTEEREKYEKIWEEYNAKISPLLKATVAPEVEKTKPAEPTIEPLTTTTTSSLSPEDILKSLDNMSNESDFERNSRLKLSGARGSKEQLDAAREWYAKSPLSKHFPFRVVLAALNAQRPGPAAKWAINGVTLFRYYNNPDVSGDYTDLYHEAWHGFTQTFLTPEEREAMYKEARKKKGSFTDYKGNRVTFANATWKQLEEFLAEDFRAYMMSGGKTKDKSAPTKNGIFTRIMNFLKELFSGVNINDVNYNPLGIPKIQAMYENLKLGNLSSYNFDVENRDKTIASLDHAMIASKKDENMPEIDFETTNKIIGSVNSIISAYTNQRNTTKDLKLDRNVYSYTTTLMKDKTRALAVYAYVKSIFQNETLPKLNEDLAEAKAKADNEYEVLAIEQDIRGIEWAINNFGDLTNLANNKDGKDVIGYHLKTSKLLTEEDRAELLEETSEVDALIKASDKFDRPGNDVGMYDMAPPEVKYVLSTIHKWEGTKPVMNSFGIQELSDPSVVWNRVARTLKGTMTPSEMYEKLQAAAGKDPIIGDLLKKLGPVKSEATAAETDLWIKFWSVFNKAEIPLMQMTVFREKDNQGHELDKYTIKIGSNNSVSRIAQTRWTNTFTTVTSDYRKRDPQKANEVYMDVKKVLETFGTKQPNGTYKLTSEKDSYEFFKAIGIELSDSDELRDIVNKGKGKASRIFERLDNILSRGTDKIYNLKDIFKEYPAVDKIKALSSETTLADLANEEIKFADYASNYAVNNAEGNIQFEQSLHNSISIMVNAINSSKDYADLISKPFMSHLDIAKNPFAKASVWLNSIYDMSNYEAGDPTKVGPKRSQKSDTNVKAMINMSNLSGVSIVSDKRDEGIASANADEFTKLILDFHVSNIIGRPELMRHADKGTSFSLWLSDVITPGSSDNKAYVDTIDFINQPSATGEYVPGYGKASQILKKYIDAEMQRMSKLKALKDQKDLIYDANYLKEGQGFVIFEDVLSPKTRAFLSNYSTLAEAAGVDPDISNDIDTEIAKYFDNQSKQVGKMMNKANYISENLIVKTATDASKSNKQNVTNKNVKNALIKSFVVNSWLHNIESMAIIYGDIAQYKMAKEEFHKRNAGAGSTGGLLVSDPVFIDYVNKKGRLYAQKRGIFGPDGQTKKLASDGSFQSAILEDNNIRSEYFEDIADALIESETEKLGSREKAIKKVLGFEVNKEGKETGKIGTIADPFKNGSVHAYTDMNEGDAQGWITFDFYRATAILEGSWTPTQEKLYKKIINEEPVDYSEVLNFFPTKKYQYWGPVQHKDKDGKAIDGPPLTAFHKFSLFPLIPNVIKGKNLDALHTRMMEKGIDYAMFESGSKISNFTRINADGKADKDKFYSNVDGQDRTVNATGDLVPNTVFLQFLKNQLEIAPYFKGKVTFPTQMRKLIENGLMEAGVPTDFRRDVKNVAAREKLWREASPEEKNKSEFYKLVKMYEKDLADLTELKMKKLEKEAKIKRDKDGNVIFNEDLAQFIIKELDRQDLAQHEIGFIKSGTNNTLAHDLSYSLSSEKIEKILNSIVVKRLVKQKFKGEGLIQVSGAGFENTLRGELTDEEKAKYGTNGLSFYKRKGGPNGTTSAMKVKIALQGSFENLLYLDHKDGQEIGTIERLNEMLKDESWLDIGDHRKMISITGPRIPTQENNSMEFAEIYEFLPREAGNIVVLPSEIVAKSGGDFDIDKITFMMPNISSGINWESWLTPEGSAKRNDLQKSTNLDLSEANVKRIVENRKQDDQPLEDQAVLRLLANNSSKKVSFPFTSKTEEGLENRILDDMKNILALKENYVSLVRPNGTDIVKPLADELSSKVMDYNPKKRLYPTDNDSRIAGTRVFEIPYNMYKHTSNNIGKQTLGLGAVDNTFNTVFNRIGARMNHEYWASKNVKRRLDLLFEHNTLKDNQNRDVISLSHLMDVNNDNSISSIIGQLINGWVDIAKDAWIFNLQGNKEISPSLLFMVQAGVPLKQAVYFVSQPIIREYVKEMQQAKSTFAGPMGKGTDNPNMFRGEARKLIFKKLGYDDKQMAVFNGKNEDKQEFLNNRTLQLTDKETGSEIDFFDPAKVEQNLKNKIDAHAEAIKNEKEPVYDIKDEAVFLHFLEIEEMTNSATKFKMALNVDTSKTNNVFEALSKNQLIEDLKADGKLPAEIVTLIQEESPIGSFFTQDFQIGLWKNLFKLRNDDDLNKWILNKTTSRNFKDEVDDTFGDDQRFVSNLRNDWISFLFQNQIRKFDIDNVKDYKGLAIQDTFGVKLAPSIKYGVFVAPDKTGELTIYMDKVKLRQDFAKLSSRTNLENVTVLPDGTIIKPADVDFAAFPTPDSYYKFVIERELLRAMYPGKTKWPVLLERADVSRRLTDALESAPTLEGESKEKREARINTQVYEEVLRDRALENTYNTWKMFQSRTSMADQFNEIAALYPELRKNYSLMNVLTGTIRNDKNNANRIGNLQLMDSLLDGNKLNLFHQNLKDMSDPSKLRINVKTAQERIRIAEFFNKFALYAFLQSGLNTSGRFSLTRVVPQEMFTQMMSEYMGDFMKNMNELTFERYYKKFKDINSRAGSTSYRDYTIPGFDMAADKNKLDTTPASAKELIGTEKKSRIDNFYPDNAGNILYHANKVVLNEGDKLEAITKSAAKDILESKPSDVIIFNGAVGNPGEGATGEAAFSSSLTTHSNLIAFPVKTNYNIIDGQLPSSAIIYDIPVEEADKLKAQIKEQEKIINKLVSAPKLEVGIYAEYNGDTYIVTQKNDVGTWQIYNPTTGVKVSVSPNKLTLSTDKPISLTNRDIKYWVSPLHENAIVSQKSNTKMNWPADSGLRKEIMAKVESQIPNKNAVKENIDQPAQHTFKFADGTIVDTPFKLNEQQEQALLSLENFFNKPGEYDNQITLLGYAGTGKTSIITIFDKYLRNKWVKPIYSSPTHRANAVTKLKNPKASVYTLHSLFGLKGAIKLEDGDYDLRDLEFAAFDKDGKLNKNAKAQNGDVLIIDEASMVNDSLYEFLEKFKKILNLKIIYMGDPAQLKPVKQKHLSKALEQGTKLQLTKVERTGDNPILEESTNLRNGEDLNYQTKMVGPQGVEYSNEANFVNKTIGENYTSEEFKTNKLYFRILSATNRAVTAINTKVRDLLYDEEASKQIVPGELLMGYNNFGVDYKTKQPLIINSGDYMVDTVQDSTKTIEVGDKTLVFNGFQVRLKNVLDQEEPAKTVFIVDNNESDEKLNAFMNEVDRLNKKGSELMSRGQFSGAAQSFEEARKLESSLAFMRELVSDNNKVKVKKTLDYGYAHTIHKSQGGTYNKVLILADTINNFPGEDEQARQQLKYVAMSRASEKVYVATNHKLGEPIIRDGLVAPGDVAPTVEPVEKVETSVKPTIDLNREWKGDLNTRPVYTKEGINTMRTEVAKANEHFGNPFSEAGYGDTIKVPSIGAAVVAYKEWLLGTNHKNVKPQQREWILDQINQGKLDGATLLYAGKSAARGQGMHPTALAEVVEELRGEQPQASNIPQDTREWTSPIKSTQSSTSDKPKGEEVKPGIYVNQEALTKEEQLELFDLLKPYLEQQAAKTNKGTDASKMIGLGLRWDYKSNNPGKTAMNISDVINPGNKNKYGYYDQSINGKPLGQITPRFRQLMQKATGVDMTNYDGAIINLYEANSFISSHNDVDESKSAINYPVIGINIGGTGNFSIESRDGSPKQLDLKAGTGYVFGVDGVNREVWHRTFPKAQDSFLPELTTKIDGKTYEPGSYRITITMRRVMPLQEGMPNKPAMVTTQLQGSNIPQDTRDGQDVQDDSKTPRPINGLVIDPTLKAAIDKTLLSMQQKKNAGMTLNFPVNGIGQHMIGADPLTGKLIGDIKPIALSSFVYLSEQLFEKFGYVNPNYEKVLGYLGEKNSVQAESEVTDDMLDTALAFCFTNI